MVYDNGSLYHPSILDITDDDIRARFIEGAAIVTMVSLGIGYPTKTSVPHMVTNAFRWASSFSNECIMCLLVSWLLCYKCSFWVHYDITWGMRLTCPVIRCEIFTLENFFSSLPPRNLLAIALETDYTFKEAAELKELMSDPTKLLALAAAVVEEAPAAESAAEEEVSG